MFDKEKFSEVLLKARGNRTNEEYARASGVSRSYISAYINSRREDPPSPEILKKLADKAFNEVSYSDFMQASGFLSVFETKWIGRDDGYIEFYDENEKSIDIPILGVIQAGHPILAEQNILGYAPIPERQHKSAPGSFFFLRVKGDSMTNSRIEDGDLVLVRKQPNVENGDIAVILINHEEATIKRVYYDYDNKLITIRPDNPKYEPRTFTFKQAAEIPVEIIGKVMQVRFDL